jgi:O-antigen ligase
MGFDSYLLGVGIRGFPTTFTNYFTKHESIGIIEPHNLFYTLFAEIGLIGFLLYLWILYRISYLGYINFKNESTSLKGIVNLSLLLTFIAYIFFYQFYGGGMTDNNFWIICSLIIANRILYLKNNNASVKVRN